MKITILAAGSRGDTQPYIALGSGLKHAGHTVTIACFDKFKSLVTDAGLIHFPILGDIDRAKEEAAMMGAMQADNPLKVMASFRKMRDAASNVQIHFFDACQEADAVIYHPGVTLAYFIARKRNIPAVLATPFPMSATRAYASVLFYDKVPNIPILNLATQRFTQRVMWMASRMGVERFWKARFQTLPDDFGMPFIKQNTTRYPTIISCSPHIFAQAEDFPANTFMTGYWNLPAPADWQPPADLLDFLNTGSAPVYVGFGSLGSSDYAQETETILIEALRNSGERGILSGKWKNLTSALRENKRIFFLESAPHSWLFPKMAAVVHHGGAGTTAAGFTAGIPQIIVPFSNDQFAWGKRVHELGAGSIPIPRKNLSAEKLADAIKLALSASTQTAAAKLGENIRTEDGVGNAVQIVERALSG